MGDQQHSARGGDRGGGVMPYLITDEVTGFVDGYYCDNGDALDVAKYWQERLGNPMEVRFVKNGPPIPDSIFMAKNLPSDEVPP